VGSNREIWQQGQIWAVHTAVRATSTTVGTRRTDRTIAGTRRIDRIGSWYAPYRSHIHGYALYKPYRVHVLAVQAAGIDRIGHIGWWAEALGSKVLAVIFVSFLSGQM